MSEIEFAPCTEWAEKLADFWAHRLLSSDEPALEDHLASCKACARVLLDYQWMDERIHQALDIRPLPTLSLDLLPDREDPAQVFDGLSALPPESGEAARLLMSSVLRNRIWNHLHRSDTQRDTA
jgi:hypothetical protein